MVSDEVSSEVTSEAGVVEPRSMLPIVFEKFGPRYARCPKPINVHHHGVKLMISVETSWLKKPGSEFC